MPSRTDLLQADFTAGIRRSRARDALGRSRGANVLWDARDWIIGRLGVPLGKRGGWGYQGSAFPSDDVTPSWVAAMSNDPFNGGNYMRAIDADLNIWVSAGPTFASWFLEHDYNSHSTIYPATGLPRQNGVFIADGLFFPSADGTLLGSTHNEIYGQDWNMAAGAGDEVIYLASHLNRLVGLDAHENLWFGNPNPDLAVWDEDAKYNLGQPGTGLISTGKELLVFCNGRTYKVLGQIPAGYGITQDDIEIQLFDGAIGCADAFSIVHWNTNAIWFDENGLWMTDGATYPLDLAWAGNALDLFREFMESYEDRETTRVACGIHSNMLIVSMTSVSTGEFIDCLVCDLPRRVWSRWTNSPFTCFVRGALGQAETWAGIGAVEAHVAKISPVLDPTWDNHADADGTDVEPSFQTASYRFGPQDSRIHRAFLGYEIEYNEQPPGAAETTFQDWLVVTSPTDFDYTGWSLQFLVSDAYLTISVEYVAGTTISGGYAIIYIPGEGSAGTCTLADVKTAIDGSAMNADGFTVAVDAGHVGDTVLVASALSPNTMTGGSPADIADAVVLQVDYATDPRAEPSFESYASDLIELEPRDIHGTPDAGYHWKPVPVRKAGSVLAIRVRQSGPSAKTSIHGIGAEQNPHPVYSQR